MAAVSISIFRSAGINVTTAIFYSIPLSRLDSKERKDLVGAYISRLISEIDERADLHSREWIRSISRGTPSLLDPEDVTRLLIPTSALAVAPERNHDRMQTRGLLVSRCSQYRDSASPVSRWESRP
jgi:hypothetical protein